MKNNTLKNCLLLTFETLIPLTFFGLSLYFIFAKELNIEISEYKNAIITSVTLYNGIIITTLSVLASSKNFSITKLSKNEGFLKRFIAYVFIAFFLSNIVLLLSFFSASYVKIFLFFFCLYLYFSYSYSFCMICIFYKNMKEMKKEEEKGNEIIVSIEEIRENSRNLKYLSQDLERIKKHLEKERKGGKCGAQL